MSWIRSLLLMCALAVVVVRGQECAETANFFSEHQLQYNWRPNDGPSSVCGRASCCSKQHDADLLHAAKRQMREDLRTGFSSSLYLLERLSSQLDASICNSLQEAQNESDSVLQHTYGPYYQRNNGMFSDFFCRLSFAASRADCCYCEQEMEEIVFTFLRDLVFVALKEQSRILSVSQRFEKCVHRVMTVAALKEIFAENRVNWLLSRLKRQICLPCHMRQGLRVAHNFVHNSITKTEVSQECLEGLRCVYSCSCCAGEANCRTKKPCFSCCESAMLACSREGLGPSSAPFSWLLKELGRAAAESADGKPDEVLDSLGVNLSEMIMEIYLKTEETLEQISGTCGTIHENALSTRSPNPPLKCPVCSSDNSEILKALRSVQSEADLLSRTFENISHGSCSATAGSPSGPQGCAGCNDCQFRSGNTSSATETILTKLVVDLPRFFRPPKARFPNSMAMPAFSCTKPTTFPERVYVPGAPGSPNIQPGSPGTANGDNRGGIICDDEDVNCCQQGSGDESGSGSGDGGCIGSGSGDSSSGSSGAGGSIKPVERGNDTVVRATFTLPGPITRAPIGAAATTAGEKETKSSSAPSSAHLLHTAVYVLLAVISATLAAAC
eukprot:scpid56926/ scgid27373/ 